MILFSFLVGCASHIDNYTLKKIVPLGMSQADLHKACALGESLNHPLRSLTKATPNRAMIIAETTAALCFDVQSMQYDIASEQHKFLKNIPQAIDAKITAERLHTMAARRYHQAYTYTQDAYGVIGNGTCPKLRTHDQPAYLIGLIAGTLAVIHSRMGGGEAGVPDAILPKVARATDCLDNSLWWHTPQALQSAVWAFIPGSGPQDIDAWQRLEEAGTEGAKSSFRIAWGIHNLIASISDKQENLKRGILAHAEAIEVKPVGGDWALLDEYVFWVTRHHSDLIWVKEKGHRTPTLGEWPEEEKPSQQEEIPFEEDPF